MKNYSYLLLASLAVLTSSASAAQSQIESDLVVLPTYIVSVPRYSPAEERINASLDELRQRAHMPAVISPDLSALKAQVARQEARALAQITQNTGAGRVAKS
jgi:hypothetical protein